MSLKSKLEAVIYAAEEPVTLAQLAALFAADALEWKAAQQVAAAEQAAEYAGEPPVTVELEPLLGSELAYPRLDSEAAMPSPDAEPAGLAEAAVESAPGEPVADAEGTPGSGGRGSGRPGIRVAPLRILRRPKGRPEPIDFDEPRRVAEAVAKLGLLHAVVTSVNRDDDLLGGARAFAMVIEEIRRQAPGCRVEVLIPDFQGNREAIRIVVDARPEVLNHNTESVPRLYRVVRSGARYERSLELLRYAKELNPAGITKSGVMVGLGEETAELLAVFRDLAAVHCDILTIGQYLRPSRDHLPMARLYTPREFAELKTEALKHGLPPRRVRPARPLQLPRPRAGRLDRADRGGVRRSLLTSPTRAANERSDEAECLRSLCQLANPPTRVAGLTRRL